LVNLGTQWAVVDGLITHAGKIFVPSDSALVSIILAAVHDMGHEGIQKTLWRVRADFCISKDKQLVADYVRSWGIFQRNKTEHLHPAGLLQPLEIPSQVWADIISRLCGRLAEGKWKNFPLSVVDRFSRYAHFIALSHPYTASSVACIFFDEIVCLHSLPQSIVSDHDPTFTTLGKSFFVPPLSSSILVQHFIHNLMAKQR